METVDGSNCGWNCNEYDYISKNVYLAVKFYVEFYSFYYIIILEKDVLNFVEGRMCMPNILPVSDLRNYNEVLKNCQSGEPVFLTKNGRGRFVILDIEDYERDRAEKKLLKKLQEAEEAVKDGEGWLSLEELKAAMEG